MTDSAQIATTLDHALRVHLELHRTIGEQRASQGERVSGTREAQVPINLDAMDQRDLLADQIIGWASIIEEESGEQCSRLNAQTAGRWMRERTAWIAGAEWADAMVEELRTTTRRGEGLLGELPRRTKLATPCECGAQQWIVHDGGVALRCAAGHVSTPGDAGTIPDGEPLTILQVSRLVDVSRSTIDGMIRRGVIAATGEPLRIPRCEVPKIREALAI